MTSAATTSRRFGIGDVIAALKPDFPDVTISKIRFLESEGLVQPQRTSSGYRKFSDTDVERLRFILTAQRDHYLPLKVIREHLGSADQRGESPGPIKSGGSKSRTRPTAVEAASIAGGLSANALEATAADARISRAELLEAAGLKEAQLAALESYGLVTSRGGSQFDATAVLIAQTVSDMMEFGIEPRHLRSFKVAADREVSLMAQVMTPMLKSRADDSRKKAQDKIRDLAALSIRLHAALVKAGLDEDVLG